MRPVTAESAWESWAPLHALPALRPPGGRVAVVSAHPDDEVLGAGGLLGLLADASTDVRFVTATDGEASHPGAPMAPADLARRRAHELLRALAMLGYGAPRVTRLGLPDSGLGPHQARLGEELRKATDDVELVLCPAALDGHIDHATVGRLALDVCRGRVPVWQYPIWMWHWDAPGGGSAQWERAGRIELTPDIAARKRAALQCFTTQLAPLPLDPTADVILPPEVLAHFDRSYEVFFT